ncbi:unnamed protein product [Brassicogethes aeneus]|uniref:Macro domain-containing protein n=1 Tax=Brassicogethes aeneus TaxID=1431903 RepID=A0A9P0FKY0_BRAAE|nr:unnamed protein product [Brassicogethes aeneus]
MRIKMNQEPLGVAPDIVLPQNLERWSEKSSMHNLTDYSAIGASKHDTSPFPFDPEINQKIVLWTGDISSLQVDAIVNSTNESMSDSNPVSDRIFQRAGSELKEEINLDIRECRTGEVRVTQGHALPARYIIHTVGPKYNIKYQSASENTLHTCYRNILQKSKENGIHTLAIPVVNSVKRNYPPDEGAHIGLRSVRRFLERHGSCLDTVIFVVDKLDLGIYEVLLPLYFPRSKFEEDAARWQLPSEVGGPEGEPIMPDRQIRIIDNPQHTLHADEESIDLSSQLDTSVNVGEHAFSQMQGDLDQQRLLGERTYNDPLADIMIKEIQHQER